MEIYNPGDILLLRFPFTNEADRKRRPALVVLDVGDNDIVVARITTHESRSKFDVEIKEWKAAGLKAASVVRLHKLATLEKDLIDRKLGTLAKDDLLVVRSKFKDLMDSVTKEDLA